MQFAGAPHRTTEAAKSRKGKRGVRAFDVSIDECRSDPFCFFVRPFPVVSFSFFFLSPVLNRNPSTQQQNGGAFTCVKSLSISNKTCGGEERTRAAAEEENPFQPDSKAAQPPALHSHHRVK